MGYGNNSRVAISFQNSYGTSLTNSLYWLPIISEGVGLEKEQLISGEMRAIFDEGTHYEGKNTVSGPIAVEAQAIPLGVMMKAVFGDPTTVTSDAVYTHTFKPRTADFDGKAANIPVTVHKYLDQGGSASLFYDLVGSTFELGIANGELLKATVEFMGGKESQTAAVATSYGTGEHFTWDVASVSMASSATTEVMDITVKVDEKLEGGFTLDGNKTPSRVKRTGFRETTINGTLKFEDQRHYQDFKAQSNQDMTIHMVNESEIQSGYFESLTVTTPLRRFTELKPVADGPGEVEVSFSAKGVYSATSATAIAFTLVNTQAAY